MRFLTTSSSLAVMVFAIASPAGAQNVIPQIADGGGWQTTLVIANTSANQATTSISFFQQSQSATTTSPWQLGFLETNTTQNITLAGGGTTIIHSTDTAPIVTVGWAQVQGDPAIVVYAVFTQHVTGRPDQDCTVLQTTPSSRVLVPYDNTNGFTTAMAIINTGAANQTINVKVKNSAAAASSTPSPLALPPQGHMQFNVSDQFATTAQFSGMAEFTTTGGSIAVVAIRFNSSGSFTTAPVFPGSGAAIISSLRGPGALAALRALNRAGAPGLSDVFFGPSK